MRIAFGEIANGINRIGAVLAGLLSRETADVQVGKAMGADLKDEELKVPAPKSVTKGKAKSTQNGALDTTATIVATITPPTTPSASLTKTAVEDEAVNKGSTDANAKLQTAASAPAKPSKPPRDPNFPKKPPGSFLIFARHMREQVARENPNLSYLEITKLLGTLWETADKKRFEAESARMLDIHKKEVEQYLKKHDMATKDESASDNPVTIEEINPMEPESLATKENKNVKEDKESKKGKETKDADDVIKIKETPSEETPKKKSSNKEDTSASTKGEKEKKKKSKKREAETSAPEAQEFIGEKGPLAPLPSSQQLLFSSSQPSTVGSQVAQPITEPETQPLKPKKKKKISTPSGETSLHK